MKNIIKNKFIKERDEYEKFFR
jgi:hypothetical protein